MEQSIEQTRHLLDDAWDTVSLRETKRRFPVLCGRVVGIDAVTRISPRPICAECLSEANLRMALRP
jgi:hypothetical protein